MPRPTLRAGLDFRSSGEFLAAINPGVSGGDGIETPVCHRQRNDSERPFSRAEKGLESGGIRRHKFWCACSLRSDDLIAALTPLEPLFLINSEHGEMAQKAPKSCHFVPLFGPCLDCRALAANRPEGDHQGVRKRQKGRIDGDGQV
jgi:hypothetical protein